MKEKIVDIIDTSSRISDEELSDFLDEIEALSESDIEVIECDTKVENKGMGKVWELTLKAHISAKKDEVQTKISLKEFADYIREIRTKFVKQAEEIR